MQSNRAKVNYQTLLLILEKTSKADPEYLGKSEDFLRQYPFATHAWETLAYVYHEDYFNKTKAKQMQAYQIRKGNFAKQAVALSVDQILRLASRGFSE
jgi:hypothetical protein